jgi:CheY-like chemotaxis protein
MRKKALIVDDEEIVRNCVERALSSRGWSVSGTPDGASAIALIEKEDFDVMICDLKMPGMRGEEVIKKMRTLRPAVKIIVITGSVSDLASPPVPGVEVNGFLIKPFGIDEIRAMTARVLKD